MAEAEDIEEIEQAVELVERVAAIDIAKASGMVCVRLPHEDQRRDPGPGRPPRLPGRHPGGHGSHIDLLEALLLPPGVARPGVLAGQRP
jgi:hypothetical protein